MPFIRESIVTTVQEDGSTHITPLGVHETEQGLMIAPFKPSATLDNLLRTGVACINYTDDVRVYAGCLTDRRGWPVCDASMIQCTRLQGCLAHTEVRVHTQQNDDIRPRFYCETVHEASHQPFHGYNRAQFAVIELAILVSRLSMLPMEKITREIEYLSIGLQKTAGPREQQAWDWLMAKVSQHRSEQEKAQLK